MYSGLPFLSQRRRSVLSRAVARWRAGNYSSTLDALIDESGNGLHARLGSSVGADSNDPLRLQYSGEKYVYSSGVFGDYISTPDSAALDITGDIDLIWCGACADWTPSAIRGLIAKNADTGSQASYRLHLNTNGTLRFGWSTDGTTANRVFVDSTAAPTVSDGGEIWLRATLDVNDGAGHYVVTFYTSTDGVNWTQLGAAITGGTTTSVFAGTAPLEIGSINATSSAGFDGKIYRAIVKNGIDGTVVADFDASLLSEPYATYTDPQGNVWTLNRSASGRKLAVVDRDMLLLGTDDYLEVANHPLLNFGAGQSFTVAMLVRAYGVAGATTAWLSKKASAAAGSAGYYLERSSATTRFKAETSDGTNTGSGNASVPTAGYMVLGGMVVNRGNQTIRDFFDSTLSNTASVSSVGSLANTQPLYVGRISAAYVDMEFVAAAIFREALSVDDLRRLAAEMGVAP